jgi:plasmid replication initiation protein
MNNLTNPKESQIIQQNKILLGGQGINLRARQLIYVLAHLMDKEEPTDMITVSAKDFLNYINASEEHTGKKKGKWSDIYALTSEIFNHLNENPILIKKPRGKDYAKINWLSELGVERGMIKARFSTSIAEYFLFKHGLPYTKLLWDLRTYKSNFTVRIIDLFQKYHIKESGTWELAFDYDLEELKFFFGVNEKYPRLYDFEKRVLRVAEQELEENDDAPYWFTYDKIKSGKAVSAIRFNLHVRREALLRKAPDVRIIENTNPTLFEIQEEKNFTPNQKSLVEKLAKLNIKEEFALRVISALTEPQGMAYFYLVDYGVNRNLAFNIVKDHCSFGELIDNEHLYVKHTLDLIEDARLKRIEEVQKGKIKKRTTPKNKRGGLPKKVFEEKLHFPSFMEKLSTVRNSRKSHFENTEHANGFKDLANIIKKM